ncbi:MAG: creatininase family protein [Candidatus Aminicenantes bacterium]|nr:creatininase family protein [Candidatus Aminicenantes bacterium]
MKSFTKICLFGFTAMILLIGYPSGSDTGPTETKGGYSIFHETMVDMTWQQVEKAAADSAVILTNTDVIEEHGPHMSCGIDSYLGYLICKLTRRELEKKNVKTLIAPPFYWGINNSSHVFPGSFTVREETMIAVLYDMFNSLKNMGFTDIFNINSHGDGTHIRTALKAIIKAREELGLNIRYLMSDIDAKRSGLDKEAPPFLLIFKAPPWSGGDSKFMDLHAGAWETGAVAAFFPDVMDQTTARKQKATKVTADQLGEWVRDMKKVTPLGYLGDPAGFDAASGRKEIENICRGMAEAIAASRK